jgi:hypothetical protein
VVSYLLEESYLFFYLWQVELHFEPYIPRDVKQICDEHTLGELSHILHLDHGVK